MTSHVKIYAKHVCCVFIKDRGMAEVNRRPSPLRKVNYREKQDIYVLNLTWFHCQTYFGVVSSNIVINFTCMHATPFPSDKRKSRER